MKFLTSWWPLSPRGTLIFRAAVALLMAGAWFLKIAPSQRAMVYRYIAEDGLNNRIWWEVSLREARTDWRFWHADSIGEGGGRDEIPWLIAGGPSGKAFWSSGRSRALALITNQYPGKTREKWETWWQENKDGTQEEWILQGFALQGFGVQVPPSRETCLMMLKSVGSAFYNSKTASSRDGPPGYDHLVINAMRLLRDHEFDATSITPQELANDTHGQLLRGLLQYHHWQKSHPMMNGVGVVFAKPEQVKDPRDFHFLGTVIAPLAWWGMVVFLLSTSLRGAVAGH